MKNAQKQFSQLFLPILFGTVLGYSFFLFAGFIPGVWEFFIPEQWRDAATAGFARFAGATVFVFFSSMFGKENKKKVSEYALLISIAYFLIAEAFFLWAFRHGIVPTVWFPLLMTACGISGSLIGYVAAVITYRSERAANKAEQDNPITIPKNPKNHTD